MPTALRRVRSTGQAEGVRVVILDTGLDLDCDAPEIHLWMDGVVGDDDPAIEPRRTPGEPDPDPDRRELR